MKSVFLRPTGKHDGDGNEIREPVFLSNRVTATKSLFSGGRRENGLDLRLNAAATTNQEATGYQILIDTMTYIKAQESKQVYYELSGKSPSDFVPIAVGDGAWASNILTRRTFTNSGDWEASLTRQSSNNERSTQSEVSMDSITIPVDTWDDAVTYTLAEIEQALVASQWDIIAAKHASRMKKWQLGVQATTFLGTRSLSQEGLFINTKTNVNTAFITAYIKGLNTADFSTFVGGLINLYFTNTNSTQLPTHFVIPMVDFLGLMVPVPGTTTLTPMIHYLKLAFQELCGSNFQIVGNAYADAATSNSLRGVNKNTYALYRKDPEGLRRDIPVDFTVTQPNSLDNFHFQDTAYAQITGVGFYKPLETLLFQF